MAGIASVYSLDTHPCFRQSLLPGVRFLPQLVRDWGEFAGLDAKFSGVQRKSHPGSHCALGAREASSRYKG